MYNRRGKVLKIDHPVDKTGIQIGVQRPETEGEKEWSEITTWHEGRGAPK